MSERAAIDVLRYDFAKAKSAEARQACEAASARLELMRVRERLMEIRCQHEPLASLANKYPDERARAYAAAFYVVIGRFPTDSPSPDTEGGRK